MQLGWSYGWEDFAAKGRLNFRQQCLDDWDAQTTDMESREIQQALDACEDILEQAPAISCSEWRALYIEF